MAKLSAVQKSKKRFKGMQHYYVKREKLKGISKNINLEYEEREQAQVALNQMSRNTSMVRHRRRCMMCGRPRGVYRKFALCRLCLRSALMRGLVPGAKKSSW